MPAVAQTGNSKMSVIVSGNATGAQRLADFHGVERVVGYSAYDDLLLSDEIDAVYIALPNSMHADYAIRAAKAGKHVMVEKPLATTIAESEAMIAAARENGVFLMTAYRLHQEPGTVAVLEAIRAGKIGDPRYFTSVFSFQMAAGNHRLKAEHWGGPLQDVGVYCLNAARHVFSAEPTEVIAMASRPPDDPRFTETDAAVAVTLRFPGEGLAQFYCSFGAGELDNYTVVGSKGVLSVEKGYRFETTPRPVLTTAEGTEVLAVENVDHFGAQIAYFSDCILKGEAPEPDGEEGLCDMRVMLAIEEAVRTGTPQRIHNPERSRHPQRDMVRLVPRTTKRLLL